MSYPYYLVSYLRSSTEEISTNVYANSEADARVVGSVKLKDFYGISIPSSALTVELISSLSSDNLTTT